MRAVLDKYELIAKELLLKNQHDVSHVDFSSEFISRLARLNSSDENIINSKSIEGALDYTFFRFIDLINKKGGLLKDVLNKLYSGALLSEVVLSIKEPSIDSSSIEGKVFYIDMPILLSVLGLNDKYSVDCSRKLVKLIQELGGIVTTTENYIEEAELAIKLSLENYNNRGKRTTSLDMFLFRHSENAVHARIISNSVSKFLAEDHLFELDDSYTKIDKKFESMKAAELRDSISESISWYKKILRAKMMQKRFHMLWLGMDTAR